MERRLKIKIKEAEKRTKRWARGEDVGFPGYDIKKREIGHLAKKEATKIDIREAIRGEVVG